MAAPTDDQLLSIVNEAFDEAFEILYKEDGWKEEKKNSEGDVVVSRKSKKGRKICRITGVLDCDTKKLAAKLADTHDLTNWNKTLIKHEILKKVNDEVTVTYQVTAGGGPGDIVSSRDFVLVFKSAWKDDCFVQAGRSIDMPGAPTTPKAVRAENGPTGTVIRALPDGKTEFRWLMDCEYKGWIPSSVLEIAMPIAQMDFLGCVRKMSKTL